MLVSKQLLTIYQSPTSNSSLNVYSSLCPLKRLSSRFSSRFTRFIANKKDAYLKLEKRKARRKKHKYRGIEHLSNWHTSTKIYSSPLKFTYGAWFFDWELNFFYSSNSICKQPLIHPIKLGDCLHSIKKKMRLPFLSQTQIVKWSFPSAMGLFCICT